MRAHLLSQEARQRLSDLELEIENLERKLGARGEWVAEQVVSTARTLTHAVKELLSPKSEEPAITRARDVMTRDVRTCHPEDTLHCAAAIMWEANVGAVPVVDDAGKLVGMITDRDVCMGAYTQGVSLAEGKIRRSMSNELFTCRPEDSLRKVMEVMATKQVRRVPVVDQDGRLVGIVALADVARFAEAPTQTSFEARSAMSGVMANISEPSGRSSRASSDAAPA